MNFETARNTNRGRVALVVIHMVAAYYLFRILCFQRLIVLLHITPFDISPEGNLMVMKQRIGIGCAFFSSY